MLNPPRRKVKRTRSGGRRIKCPEHGCFVHSTSQKHRLFTCTAQYGQHFGANGRQALVETPGEVCVTDEWLEAFWCPECQDTNWHLVKKTETGHELASIPPRLWERTLGTVYPWGNPSVSEYSRKQSRPPQYG